MGRVAVVTGASSGIGQAAARALLEQGWQVIGVGRNPERSAAAEAALREAVPGGEVTMLRCDLSLIAEVDRLAEEIAAITDRVHLLANNAGFMTDDMRETSEGLEENFAANHVGPFRLTERLLPLLRKAASESEAGTVRVIMTSSDGSEMIPAINCEDLENRGNWSYGAAYCTGKLSNVLFARALAERLADDGIVAHSYHPGTVDSNFIAHTSADTQKYIASLDMITPDEGADTLVWLATSDEGGASSGTYWYKRAPRDPNPVVEQEGLLESFWDASEALVARALG